MDWRNAHKLTWCVARHYLLSYMPEFDLYFLPPSVTVEGMSMLDDNIAFTLMALNVTALDPEPPVQAEQLETALLCQVHWRYGDLDVLQSCGG